MDIPVPALILASATSHAGVSGSISAIRSRSQQASGVGKPKTLDSKDLEAVAHALEHISERITSIEQYLRKSQTLKGDIPYYHIDATADTSATLTYTQISGLTLSLGVPGLWMVMGSVAMSYSSPDGLLEVELTKNSTAQPGLILSGGNLTAGDSIISTGSRVWIVQAAKMDTVNLLVRSVGAAGASQILGDGSQLTAILLKGI